MDSLVAEKYPFLNEHNDVAEFRLPARMSALAGRGKRSASGQVPPVEERELDMRKSGDSVCGNNGC